MNELSETNLNNIIKCGKHKPIIMGDFNAKSYLWDENVTSTVNSPRANKIIRFIQNSDMVMLNEKSTTRISPIFAHKNSALDLTLVNSELIPHFKWSVEEESYGSVHLPTMLSTERNNINQHKCRIYDLENANWDTFNRVCGLNSISTECNVDQIDLQIELKIKEALEESCKFFEFPNNRKRKSPWWDQEIDKYRKDKNKHLKIYINEKTLENLIMMKRSNAIYKRALEERRKHLGKNLSVIVMVTSRSVKSGRVKKINGHNYDKIIKQLTLKAEQLLKTLRE